MRRPAATAPRVIELAPTSADAAGIEHQRSDGPSGRLVATAAGGAALWVLTWTAIQVQQGAGWALPLVPGFR